MSLVHRDLPVRVHHAELILSVSTFEIVVDANKKSRAARRGLHGSRRRVHAGAEEAIAQVLGRVPV
jgi:hypothetical protein